ncbi:MAG: helix-turn-helix transcriptional regulator [Paracoccaceae bacterium]|nr:helix-turn-helix transcriptional regulator [Paracoccaceae bacterium]
MPKDTDLHIGRRLREFREAKGLSQEDTAEQSGFPLAKIQQFEAGEHRITASELWVFCRVFGMRPSDFFEGLDAYPVSGPTEDGDPRNQ